MAIRRMLVRWTFLLVATIGAFAVPGDADGQLLPIFWVEGGAGFNGRMGRVELNGSGFQVLQSGVNNPQGVDIDAVNSHVYWTEPLGLNNGRIRRANFDGTGIVDVVTGLPAPIGLSLDLVNSKIYWTNSTHNPISNPNLNNPTVQSANLNGSNVQTHAVGPNGLAIEVDPLAGKMYWTAGLNTNVQTLNRANLNGTSPQILFTAPPNMGGTATIEGVTVGYDSTFHPTGRVYFSMHDPVSAFPYTVQSIDPNGGAPTMIASHNNVFIGLDFHPIYERVVSAALFGNQNSGEISWFKPDGSERQLLSTVGLNRGVNDVAISPLLPTVPEPASAVFLTAGIGIVACARMRSRR
jgi:hypothetical protein